MTTWSERSNKVHVLFYPHQEHIVELVLHIHIRADLFRILGDNVFYRDRLCRCWLLNLSDSVDLLVTFRARYLLTALARLLNFDAGKHGCNVFWLQHRGQIITRHDRFNIVVPERVRYSVLFKDHAHLLIALARHDQVVAKLL